MYKYQPCATPLPSLQCGATNYKSALQILANPSFQKDLTGNKLLSLRLCSRKKYTVQVRRKLKDYCLLQLKKPQKVTVSQRVEEVNIYPLSWCHPQPYTLCSSRLAGLHNQTDESSPGDDPNTDKTCKIFQRDLLNFEMK